MSGTILGTVHPVSGMAEVCDILGLSAVTVVQDNADSAFGNIASELGLAVIVGDCLSLSCARPLAVDRSTVSVPSVNICCAPAEVIGEEEGVGGIVMMLSAVLIEGNVISAVLGILSIEAVDTLAACNCSRNRYVGSLTAGAVEDNAVIQFCINVNAVDAFAVIIVADIGSRNAGPLGRRTACAPDVDVNAVPTLVVGEVQGNNIAFAAGGVDLGA